MIFISELAKEKVYDLKSQAGLGNDYFIRISVVGGGCSGLSYNIEFDDTPLPNDQVFESNDLKIVTDLKSFLYLFDSTLEFSAGLDGKGFYFQNPNASRTCGCGESFSV